MSFPAPLTKLTPIPYSLNPKRGFTTIGSHDRGFTLTEVLLAIAIITMLTVIGISLITPAKRLAQTRDAQRKNDISEIAKALGFYATVAGAFPDAQTCDSSISLGHDDEEGALYSCPPVPIGNGWNSSSGEQSSNIYQGLITDEKILKDLPKDPINNQDYYYRYRPKRSGNQNCNGTNQSAPPANCTFYWIGTKLESPKDPNKPIFRCSDMDWLAEGVGCKEVPGPLNGII